MGLLALAWAAQTAGAEEAVPKPTPPATQPAGKTQTVILWPKGVQMEVFPPIPAGTVIASDKIVLAPGVGVPRHWKLPAGAVVKKVPAGTEEAADDAPPRPSPATRTPPAPGRTSGPASVPSKTGEALPKTEHMQFRLPGACINPDGSVNPDVIVESQKERLATINKELSLSLRLVETPHFLIFSEADGPTTENFKKWSELLYNSLCNQFLIIHKERVWDGKCILVLLQSESTFQDFSKRIDGRGKPEDKQSKAAAYFMWERFKPLDKAPQLVHMVLFLEGHDPRNMRDIFAHEGTHAFVVMFRRGEMLPLWLHEGMATYMSAVNDAPLGPAMWKRVQAKVLSGSTYEHMLTDDKLSQLTTDEYLAAYAMVDYLCKLGGQKSFRQFMILLKEGRDQDAAMNSIYRYSRTEFVKQWQKYVVGSKAANR